MFAMTSASLSSVFERAPDDASVLGRHARIAVLVIVWLTSALLVIAKMDRGWVPHDEGTIAHSAERVLAGELPHRDFGEVYTGGMSYLHAGAMGVLGKRLAVPRLVVVTAFLLCVPIIFYIATRFAGPLGAGLTTLLAVVWSVPNYTAALPSWYNLILAVAGVGAVMRYLDTRHRGWLFAAGILGGLSFLIKVVGLYFVAGVLLFIVYLEQQADKREPGHRASNAAPHESTSTLYAAFVGGGLLAYVLGLIAVVGLGTQIDFVLHFIVPGGAVVVALLANERRVHAERGASAERFRELLRLAVPFLIGLAVPIVLFLAPYAATGALDDFVRGVFVTPFRRLTSAVMAPLPWVFITPSLGIVGLVLGAKWRARQEAMALAVAVAIIGTVLVVTADGSQGAYRTLFRAAVLLPPVAVVAAAVIIARPRSVARVGRERLVLLAAVVATFSLIQFPFAAPIYFCYTTPLVALLALALVAELELPTLAVPAAIAAVFIAFAVARVHPGFVHTIGSGYWRFDDLSPLAVERAEGVRVPTKAARHYETLIGVLKQRSAGEDAYIYAAPDVPEVYFLSGLRNPTRTLYDFFDEPVNRTGRILHTLRERDVRVVAINHFPEFSGRMNPELHAALRREYPEAAAIGPFEVRWRQ